MSVVCLCCASEYTIEAEQCPRFEQVPHSLERALEVARYLGQRGCEHPRPLDVRHALAALEALNRV